MKKLMTLLVLVVAMTLALPTTAEAAKKPKLTKTSVKTQKNKKVTVKIKNGKIKSVKSSNKNVATVSYKPYKKNKKNTGLSFTVKGGKKNGKATITVKTTKNKTLKCKVQNTVKKTNTTKKPDPTPTPTPTPIPVDPTPTPTPVEPTEESTEEEEPTEEPTEEDPIIVEPTEDDDTIWGVKVHDCSVEEARQITLQYFKGEVGEDVLKDHYASYYRRKSVADAAGNKCYRFNTALQHAKEIKPVIDEILAQTVGKTDYDKCRWLAYWYATNIRYDDSLTHSCAHSLLFKKIGVCEAYKEATEILLSVWGIDYDVYHYPGHVWVVAHTSGGDLTYNNDWIYDGINTSPSYENETITLYNETKGRWFTRLHEVED